MRRMHYRALLVGAFTFLASCSDLPTAPQIEPVAPQHGLIGGLVNVLTGTVDTLGKTVDTLGRTVDGVVTTVVEVLSPVLKRDQPLNRDEVVTQTIGPLGGTIVLPRAGLTVTVPPGALDRSTRITVKAPAGDLLGYEFAPHGLQFRRPVVLTQEVSRRSAAQGIEVVYFEGELQETVGVLEVLPVLTTGDRAVFQIEHFSGYALRQRGYVVATD